MKASEENSSFSVSCL